MKVQDDVPYCVEDLTADWLSRGLQASGVIDGSEVTDFAMNVLGDQVGFNGEVIIITPTYSPPAERAPASLVLKIPTASKNRILGQTMGLYEKEIRFYRDLRGDLKIRTPSGDLIPLSSIARLQETVAPRILGKFEQNNAFRILGGVLPGMTKEQALSALESAAQ